MNEYIVTIKIEQFVEAPDEDIARENAMMNLEFSDICDADCDVKELARKLKVSKSVGVK